MGKNKTLCKFFNTLNIDVKTVLEHTKKIMNFFNTHLLLKVCSEINTIKMDVNIFKLNIFENVDEAVMDYEKSDLQINCILDF